MNTDADGENESPAAKKIIEVGVLCERSKIDVGNLNVDADNRIETHESTSDLQVLGVPQVQQQQQSSQGTVVFWERFLHVRSIRVLLVENDDCTRHVVTALLRNCNYEILDAANGLQAWKILEDLNNHIDIVLTEVVMPCLSGIGLLCKIMSHETRKNIPVIMMSSHDSMGLVIKCLSKGVVDFLVKPIRKNELKNLWQHVWRRCHSSSGSGSESSTQTQKPVKGSEESGNPASGDDENDASNGLNIGDGRDDGSGAQRSLTKQAVEVDSSQALSPMDLGDKCRDSKCAQDIRSNAENPDNEMVKISLARDVNGQKQTVTVEKEENLETVMHRNVVHEFEDLSEAQPVFTGEECASHREVARKLDVKNNETDDGKGPDFKISLKRLREVWDLGRPVQDDRYVFRRSEQSAFSRYNTSRNILKVPNEMITGCSSVLDYGIEHEKREYASDMHLFSTEPTSHQCSDVVKYNTDMSFTRNKLPNYMFESTSACNGWHTSTFRPVKNDLKCSQQKVSLLPDGTHSIDLHPVEVSPQELQIQHPHQQNYHQHYESHNYFQNMKNHPSPYHDVTALKVDAEFPQCGPTVALVCPKYGNPRNYSLSRSGPGSNQGRSGQKGCSNAIDTVGNNSESDSGQIGNSKSGDGSGSSSGNRGDENRIALREAALIKFRQKMKERCFKKRVRYQNRKKIAEQRPRVRGRFVKQTGADGPNRTQHG